MFANAHPRTLVAAATLLFAAWATETILAQTQRPRVEREAGAAPSESAVPADADELAGALPDAEEAPSPDGTDRPIVAGTGERHLTPGLSSRTRDGLARLQADYAGIGVGLTGSHIDRLTGGPFGYGTSAEAAADGFVVSYADALGVVADDLYVLSLGDDAGSVPVMYDDETGSYRFTLRSYAEYRDGLPVHGAELRVLVRNEPGYPVVLAASSLRELGGFRVPPSARLAPPVGPGQAAARSVRPDLCNFGEPEYVIWAGVDEQVESPRLAVRFVADNGRAGLSDAAEWLFVVDAESGALLHSESLIVYTDITGSVKGLATDLPGADLCEAESVRALPYAKVWTGSTTAYANSAGNFTIRNAGTSAVTVNSSIAGRYFTVNNSAGANAQLSLLVTPPGPASFTHNSANTSEQNRAEVNAYVQANRVRDFVLTADPNYPTIAAQTGFAINVNINDDCNAYYNGSSINFFASSGDCANTAFSSVIYHEYGHHVVASGGSGQGAYGEGLSDAISMLITNDPVIGLGFERDCDEGLRDADNSMQYPCSGEIHSCGQLLSGCIWDAWELWKAGEVSTAYTLFPKLVINSVKLHTGTSITPQITADFLVLDDNDANLNNGTPHYNYIASGFAAHNMPPPPLGVSASDGAYCGYVRVTWTSSPYATGGYTIWRNTANNFSGAVQIGTDTASPYDDTTAAPGVTYYYWVKSVFTNGSSGFGGSDAGYRRTTPPPPTGESASDNTYCSYVRLSWTASPDATSYEIWRSTSQTSGYALIGTDTSSPYDDTGAAADTTYYYRIRAINSCGAGLFSAGDSGRRPGGVPAAPTNVSASDLAYCDRVRVTWTSASQATGYTIWRGTTSNSAQATQVGTTTASPFDDLTATAGVTYYYWVRATNGCGSSAFSSYNAGTRKVCN